jgi:hypothetical protein
MCWQKDEVADEDYDMAMCEMLWSYSSTPELLPSHRRELPPAVTCWFVGGEREFLGNSEFLGAKIFLPLKPIQLESTSKPECIFKFFKVHLSRLFNCEGVHIGQEDSSLSTLT